MNTALISDLRRLAQRANVVLVEQNEHVAAVVASAGLVVKAVIPRSATEFSIEVSDAGGVKLEDWLDYSAYEGIPKSKLAEEMRADVMQFMGRLLTRELRWSGDSKSLEWQTGNRWSQAVPFVPDADPFPKAENSRSGSH